MLVVTYIPCLAHFIFENMLYFKWETLKSYRHVQRKIREVFYIFILYFQAFQIVKWEKYMAAIFKALFAKVKPTLG